MPIYEYRCQTCGHELEVMQKLADAPLTDCPACGDPTLRKQISAVGFRFKGSGWYETDFKTGNKKNLAKEEAGSSTKSEDGKSTAGAAKTESAAPAGQ